MSKKKKRPTEKRAWDPMVRSPEWYMRECNDQVTKTIREKFPELTEEEIVEAGPRLWNNEQWGNDRYTAHVKYQDSRGKDGYLEIGIHNHKRTTIMPWSHVQQIKNEICGAEREAVMIYPAESRLLDTANEYWIYVYPVGEGPMREDGKLLGFNQGRQVADNAEGFGKAKQSRLDKGDNDA